MLIFGIFGQFVLFLSVSTALSLRYKCHRDICDSSWQFCNDGEERCNTCTDEQCEKDVAEHIFNQCETYCESRRSTKSPLTTTSHQTITLPDVISEENFWTKEIIFMSCGFTLIIFVMMAFFTFLICKLHQFEKQCSLKNLESEYSTLTNVITTIGGAQEKVPLLGSPNTETGRHDNKMDDMNALASALNGVQSSPPPSYCTDDMGNNSLNEATGECLTSIHTQASDLDSAEKDNLGNCDFLKDNLADNSTEITHPKAQD